MRSAEVRCCGGVTWCQVMWSSPLGFFPGLLCPLLRCPVYVSVLIGGCLDETPALFSQSQTETALPLLRPNGPETHSAASWTWQRHPGLPGHAKPGSWLHPAASSHSLVPPVAEQSVLSHSPASLPLTPPGVSEPGKAILESKWKKNHETIKHTANRRTWKSFFTVLNPYLLLEGFTSTFSFS